MQIDPVFASLLADAVMYLHFGIVLFNVTAFLLIAAGIHYRWRWTRYRGFRFTHLGLLVLIALQALFGKSCSLTLLENRLRKAAGEAGYERTFVSDLVGRLLYADLPMFVFTAVYLSAVFLAIILMIISPPLKR